MNGRESNAALTAKVADLERRLAAIELPAPVVVSEARPYRFTTAHDRTLGDALARLAEEVGDPSVLDTPPPQIEVGRGEVSRAGFVARLLRAKAEELETPDTRVSDAVRERERGYVCPQCGPAPEGADVHTERMHMWPPVDALGRRDVLGSQHAAGQ